MPSLTFEQNHMIAEANVDHSAGITSIVRCIKLPLLQSDDFTFRSGELAIWTVAEIATTIMATSIPVLRVFLQKMVTAHPGTTGGINPYRRSAVDGTFIKSLRSASKGTEHTTLITSGARDSTEANSFAQKSKDHRTIGFALEPDNYGKIMKVDTVAISYGHSRRNTEEDMDSSLADGSSNARSSIELTAMTRPVKDMPRNTGS